MIDFLSLSEKDKQKIADHLEKQCGHRNYEIMDPVLGLTAILAGNQVGQTGSHIVVALCCADCGFIQLYDYRKLSQALNLDLDFSPVVP